MRSLDVSTSTIALFQDKYYTRNLFIRVKIHLTFTSIYYLANPIIYFLSYFTFKDTKACVDSKSVF